MDIIYKPHVMLHRDLPLDSNSDISVSTENLVRTRDEPPDDEDSISVFDHLYFGVYLTKLVIIVWNVLMLGLMLLFVFGLAHNEMIFAEIFLFWVPGNMVIWLCTRSSISGSNIYSKDPDNMGLMTELGKILLYSLIIAIVIVAAIWLATKIT